MPEVSEGLVQSMLQDIVFVQSLGVGVPPVGADGAVVSIMNGPIWYAESFRLPALSLALTCRYQVELSVAVNVGAEVEVVQLSEVAEGVVVGS